MKLSEREYLTAAHSLVREAGAKEQDARRRRYLDDVRAGLWAMVQSASRRADQPLVFDVWTGCYAIIGRADRVRVLDMPLGLPGLRDAWNILLRAKDGPPACGPLHASDFVGNVRRPGNALRNRLANAAAWIERTAECPDLAAVLRSPSISIACDGRITLGRIPEIRLTGPA